MKNALSIFMVMMIIQLFYASSVTIIAYSLPAELQDYAQPSTSVASNIDIANVSSDLESSLQSQLNIPLIDLGALVFYSGNIIVDLLLNFLTALPQLITLVIDTIFSIMNVDGNYTLFVQTFLTGMVAIYYFLSLIVMVTNIRGRGSII